MLNELALVEDLINHGRYVEARERTLNLRNNASVDALRVNQLLALSTSKCGSPELALEYLTGLYERFPDDPETAGILGGIYKSIFRKQQSTRYALLSRDTYAKNFEQTGNYYTGINAASMSVIAGKTQQGRELANRIISQLEKTASSEWEWASLAEAYLLTKNRDQAVAAYSKARQLIGTDWGKVLSIHNQLWLLNHYLPVPKEVLRIFAPPVVVAFAGHMIDAPGRTTPRFPAALEQRIKDSIRSAIRTLQASIGYCSLACGGDILFAEVMAEEGGEVHVVIPFKQEDFVDTSIRFAGDHWIERFMLLQQKYPTTFITHDTYGGNDDLFSLLGRVIFGSAILRSQTYHQEPFLITVLSEIDMKRREGGTRDTVQLWPFPQRHTNINPDIMLAPGQPATPGLPSQPYTRTLIPNRPVLYTACIDLSSLLPMEVERITKLIKSLAGEEQLSFKVYEEQGEAILLGLETEIGLMDIVRAVWNSTAPFKTEKPLRVGLHAAPIYVNATAEDHNLKALSSISQFTPTGSICSSFGFAAVLALYPKKFQLDYVGVIKLNGDQTNSDLYQVTFK